MKARALLAVFLTACTNAVPEPDPSAALWVDLFDGVALGPWERTRFGGEGEVEVKDGAIRLGFGSPLTGIHLDAAAVARLGLRDAGYELEVVAARIAGNDFFCGLTFPVGPVGLVGPGGDSHATLVLGGWGGGLTGLSCLDGRDASENETRSFQSYERGRDYVIRVTVTPKRIHASLDGATIVDAQIAGREVGLRTEVLPSRPLGIACFNTIARVRSIRIRP